MRPESPMRLSRYGIPSLERQRERTASAAARSQQFFRAMIFLSCATPEVVRARSAFRRAREPVLLPCCGRYRTMSIAWPDHKTPKRTIALRFKVSDGFTAGPVSLVRVTDDTKQGNPRESEVTVSVFPERIKGIIAVLRKSFLRDLGA